MAIRALAYGAHSRGDKQFLGLCRPPRAASAMPAKAYVGLSGAWRSLVARVLWEH